MQSTVGSFASLVAALIAPPRCPLCLAVAEPGRPLCPQCWRAIRRAPLGTNESNRSVLDAAFAAFDYSGSVSEIVKAFKYRGVVSLAAVMSDAASRRLPRCFLTPDAVLVPAPSHPASHRARGFNPAALFTKALAKHHGLTLADQLMRDGSRPPQAQLSRADRLTMPDDAVSLRSAGLRPWRANPLAEFPTNVVVCDDVTTTGVTLEVCAYAIRERYGLHDRLVQIKGLAFASARQASPSHGG